MFLSGVPWSAKTRQLFFTSPLTPFQVVEKIASNVLKGFVDKKVGQSYVKCTYSAFFQ